MLKTWRPDLMVDILNIMVDIIVDNFALQDLFLRQNAE
jgi:hypothetical protein